MDIRLEEKVRTITFNRPHKKNCIPLETYEAITKILVEDAENDDVIITIITAKGDYFSSGNDFQSGLMHPEVDKTALVKNMIDAFIKYPKILVAVVNGPAIGIAATLITLCDIVYCSDKATFEIPFVRLGLSLEGCSSYIYPRLLGKSKASEMLFLNHILTAREAHNLGFVADVIPHEKLEEFVRSLHVYGKLPIETLRRNKALLMKWSKDKLLLCNEDETKVLEKSLESPEFFEAISLFMSKKSKL